MQVQSEDAEYAEDTRGNFSRKKMIGIWEGDTIIYKLYADCIKWAQEADIFDKDSEMLNRVAEGTEDAADFSGVVQAADTVQKKNRTLQLPPTIS